jgi:hypothetical protein
MNTGQELPVFSTLFRVLDFTPDATVHRINHQVIGHFGLPRNGKCIQRSFPLLDFIFRENAEFLPRHVLDSHGIAFAPVLIIAEL